MDLNSRRVFISAVRRAFPANLYLRAAGAWHLRDDLEWLFRNRKSIHRPQTFIFFGVAPGDDLLCTAVLRELKNRGHRDIWFMSDHPELFWDNSDVAQVLPIDRRTRDYLWVFASKSLHLNYTRTIGLDKSLSPSRHIIAELCSRAGIAGNIQLRPYYQLREAEKAKWREFQGAVAIQSSGLAARIPMQNKDWFPERFQEVVNRLVQSVKFVQIGSSTDPGLLNVFDLRGKTTIRDAAAVLANCRLYIGGSGFLMHLARAVECPAVIVYGGREAPWQTGYTCNVNLYSAVSCAPCWRSNSCPHDRVCMAKIHAGDVNRVVQEGLEKTHDSLVVDTYDL